MKRLLRIAIFQSLWFVFILKSEYGFILPLIALVLIFIDYKIFYKELEFKRFFRFTVYITVCGIMVDSILMNMQLISFENWTKTYSHPFMWAIWIIFVPYYQIGLIKLSKNKPLAIFMSLIFAPISYYSGSRLGILEITNMWSFMGIGIIWALFIPSSFLFYEKAVQGKP